MGTGDRDPLFWGAFSPSRAKLWLLAEISRLSSSQFVARGQCSCGSPYPECVYWAEVHRRLAGLNDGQPQLPNGRRRVMEAFPGLFVPQRLLRKWVASCAFSEHYPGVPFDEGIRVLADVADSTIVDISKTTRLTANRPRLLDAAGLTVELHLAWRPARDVTSAHRAAHVRRARPMSPWRAALAVRTSRALAQFAAARCARSLGVPLAKTTLNEVSVAAAQSSHLPTYEHMIAGNRGRHASFDGNEMP